MEFFVEYFFEEHDFGRLLFLRVDYYNFFLTPKQQNISEK